MAEGYDSKLWRIDRSRRAFEDYVGNPFGASNVKVHRASISVITVTGGAKKPDELLLSALDPAGLWRRGISISLLSGLQVSDYCECLNHERMCAVLWGD